jgi:hypothetical protein
MNFIYALHLACQCENMWTKMNEFHFIWSIKCLCTRWKEFTEQECAFKLCFRFHFLSNTFPICSTLQLCLRRMRAFFESFQAFMWNEYLWHISTLFSACLYSLCFGALKLNSKKNKNPMAKQPGSVKASVWECYVEKIKPQGILTWFSWSIFKILRIKEISNLFICCCLINEWTTSIRQQERAL